MFSIRNAKLGTKLLLFFIPLSVISGLVGLFINDLTGDRLLTVTAVVLTNIAIASVFLVYVSKTVNKPIEEIKKIMGAMSLNDYSLEMKGHYTGTMKELSDSISALHSRLLSVQDAFERVGQGDTSRLEEFEKIGKRSENDKLMPALTLAMSAIRLLISETGRLAAAAVNGDLTARGDETAFKGAYREIIEGLNKTMEAVANPIEEASAVMREMAAGNLTTTMNGDYKGEYARIKTDLNSAIGSFNDVLNDINSAAQQVASGARQVSDSAQTLSQGSTEQAGSIEELTASLEEISSQTRQNAVNANQANELALSAKNDAASGNGQMREMLKSINGINEASVNISKIIKVIDDIAFQTNILALNAAVEAARAGQHGKGFAVVAEEVRNLAARSANAAKETTALIESSIRQVADGTKNANDTANALDKIVDAVTRSAELVGQIATASNEQASGIAQINQGILQVSQVVQTNSATSEESAAASEELSGQAELLREKVGHFKLHETGVKQFTQLNPEMLKVIENIVSHKISSPERGQILPETKQAKKRILLQESDYGKY